jgi:hypothetical protein
MDKIPIFSLNEFKCCFCCFFRMTETLSCLLELKECIKRTTYENEINLDYITLNDKDKFKKKFD